MIVSPLHRSVVNAEICWTQTCFFIQTTNNKGDAKHSTLHYTKILEVNLFAFAYRLFHEDFSSIIGDFCMHTTLYIFNDLSHLIYRL